MADITSNLLHYWKLDEPNGSTTFADSAGSNTLTQVGSVTAGVAAQVGSGVEFPGTNGNYLDMDSALNLTGEFTVAFWAQFGHTGSPNQTVIGRVADSNSFLQFWAADRATLKIGTDLQFGNFGGTIVAGVPFHFAAVRDSSNNVTYHFNGGSASLATMTQAFEPMVIGQRQIENVDGWLDEFRVYDRALSLDDIADLIAFTGDSSVDGSMTMGRVEGPEPTMWMR